MITRWKNLVQLFLPRIVVRRQVSTATKRFLCYSSFATGIASCDNAAIKEEPIPNFSHEHCIKQACVLTVNSATTLLTTTVAAVLDICQKYRSSLLHLISLLEELSAIEGENSDIWDLVIEARANVNKIKASLTELNLYMESVEKLVNSTTETAFLAGTDYMCTALCERLYSAQKEINRNLLELKELEHDYLKMQQEVVKNAKAPEDNEQDTEATNKENDNTIFN